jgi:hypothetical protein
VKSGQLGMEQLAALHKHERPSSGSDERAPEHYQSEEAPCLFTPVLIGGCDAQHKGTMGVASVCGRSRRRHFTPRLLSAVQKLPGYPPT